MREFRHCGAVACNRRPLSRCSRVNASIWTSASSKWVRARRALSVIAGRWMASDRDMRCPWISGARRSRPMTWVTRARVIPSRRAMLACVETSPASSCRRHSWALRRRSTTRGVRGFLCGLAGRRPRPDVFTTRLAGTRRFRVPRFPFSNALLGPSLTYSRTPADPGSRVRFQDWHPGFLGAGGTQGSVTGHPPA